MVKAELEIRTSAAKVDMEADRMSSSIRIDRDWGTIFVNSTGMSASKTGLPLSNASGVVAGDRNIRVVAPIK